MTYESSDCGSIILHNNIENDVVSVLLNGHPKPVTIFIKNLLPYFLENVPGVKCKNLGNYALFNIATSPDIFQNEFELELFESERRRIYESQYCINDIAAKNIMLIGNKNDSFGLAHAAGDRPMLLRDYGLHICALYEIMVRKTKEFQQLQAIIRHPVDLFIFDLAIDNFPESTDFIAEKDNCLYIVFARVVTLILTHSTERLPWFEHSLLINTMQM